MYEWCCSDCSDSCWSLLWSTGLNTQIITFKVNTSVIQMCHFQCFICTYIKNKKTVWQCLRFCWGNPWRYFCTVCPQSGSTLHICTRTHRVVYKRCWWELQTPSPRRHTPPWACTEFSSIPTLYLHTHTHTQNVRASPQLCNSPFVSLCKHVRQCTKMKQTNMWCLNVDIPVFPCQNLCQQVFQMEPISKQLGNPC